MRKNTNLSSHEARVAMTLNTATQSQPEEKFLFREKAKESSAGLLAFYIHARAHTCMCMRVILSGCLCARPYVARGQPWVWFLRHNPPGFVERCFSLVLNMPRKIDCWPASEHNVFLALGLQHSAQCLGSGNSTQILMFVFLALVQCCGRTFSAP